MPRRRCIQGVSKVPRMPRKSKRTGSRDAVRSPLGADSETRYRPNSLAGSAVALGVDLGAVASNVVLVPRVFPGLISSFTLYCRFRQPVSLSAHNMSCCMWHKGECKRAVRHVEPPGHQMAPGLRRQGTNQWQAGDRCSIAIRLPAMEPMSSMSPSE